MDQRDQSNEINERYHSTMIELFDERLSKLGDREDGAAQFAREHLQAWKEELQDRLDAWEAAQPKFEAMGVELEAARVAFETKREELRAALEPFTSRLNVAARAYEDAARGATLTEHLIPGGGSRDPASTAALVQHFAERGGRGENSWEDLAHAQRGRSVAEIVEAIVCETEAISSAVAADEYYPAGNAVAAFAFRWQRWAQAHGLEVGPERETRTEAEAKAAPPQRPAHVQARIVKPRRASVG